MDLPQIESFTPEEKLELAQRVVRVVRSWTRDAHVKLATAQAELVGAQAAQKEYKRSEQDYGGGFDPQYGRWDSNIKHALNALEKAQKDSALCERLEVYVVDQLLVNQSAVIECDELRTQVRNLIEELEFLRTRQIL